MIVEIKMISIGTTKITPKNRSELVFFGCVDRKRPVLGGPVRSPQYLGRSWTGCGPRLRVLGAKNRTEPDLKTLATMLFSSQRLMEEHIVESIPNTTNAEEAMHWRFYSAAGRDHSFMHGMMSLYKIAVDFECQFEAVNSTYLPVSILPGTNFKLLLEGIPIPYRRPEAWKVTAAEIGRTKPTRTAKPGEKIT
jgi:hypothetical protein